ncbi:MAG: histidine phosphatase family protein [Chromatiaceae bacterium]|jgi:probable phosphoglycerate mutase|nr:histidine phosphatase family protein [Chromatiaceae bacterium]
MSTRIVLVRHGETDWNAHGRIQGHLPVPLNARGRAQARAAAARLAGLPFKAIYTSDLLRAIETAEAIARHSGHRLRHDHRLREWDLGILAGLLRAEAEHRHPEAYAIMRRRWVDRPIPGGECIRRRARRAAEALEEIARVHPGETIVVVTHGGVLGDVYRRARGADLDAQIPVDLHNAGINVVRVAGSTWSLESWGEVGHLADVGTLPNWEGQIRGRLNGAARRAPHRAP